MNRLAWVVAAGVVVVGAGFAVVTVAGADSGGHYRVASVVTGDVAQTVSVSGTVDHVNRADVSFGTDGTVAELSVGVGDTVSAGQSLGSLDTASLQAAVDKADSDLDTAETNLSSASTAAESAVSSSSSSSSSDSSSSSRGGSDSAAAGLVQEVKDAQTAASAALKAASDAMAAQTTACADPTAAACTSAGAATLTAQQAVKAAQDTLQGKLDALSTALASAEQASASAQSSDSSDSSASRSDSQAGPSGDSSASAGSVADAQAAVDQAKVKLLQAQQALAGATLTSPISGTVASVPVAVGAQASSGEAVVVVVGEGAAEVSATVTVEQLAKLATGQQATVTPVGTSAKVAGTVTRVSTLPDTSAQTVAYPVTITVDEPPASMASGSSATASIVVATAKNVLTVPTSAVNRSTVTVLNGDLTTVTRVTVGAVGPTRTEIKDGLSAGQQVVLANLDSPLPTSDTTNQGGFNNRERFGGAGGGPGGGGGGPGGGGNVVVRPGN